MGIDPGSHRLGIGCIQKAGNTFDLIWADVLEAPTKESFFDRLEKLNERFVKILKELSPDEVAVEDTFFARNAKSAFRLGIARGVAIGACLGKGIRIFEYSPTQVKSVVTGYGRADKDQVKKMVELSLGRTVPLKHDATDAIAVAICHASTQRDHQRLGQRFGGPSC